MDFLKQVNKITYEDIKKIDPEFRGLKDSIKTTYQTIGGDTIEKTKEVKVVDLIEFIPVLIGAVQELQLGRESLIAQLSDERTKNTDLALKLQMTTNMNDLINDRLAKIEGGVYVAVEDDMSKSRYV